MSRNFDWRIHRDCQEKNLQPVAKLIEDSLPREGQLRPRTVQRTGRTVLNYLYLD